MNPLTNPRTIRNLMAQYGLQFHKKFGQNFLIDSSVPFEIAQSCASGEGVLEIGPGLGTLTYELAQQVPKVVAVEIDHGLAQALPETLRDFSNIIVIEDDFLNLDLPVFCRQHFPEQKPWIAGNLPYYITTPIIMKILESNLPFSGMVLMMQKEVGERIMASPGTKAYGVLSVMVQYYARTETVVRVPRSSFLPSPNVDSVVLRFLPHEQPPVLPKNQEMFFRVVKSAFAQRRKTLLNTLCNTGHFSVSKGELEEVLRLVGISPQARGETLSLQEFCDLSDALWEKKGKVL